MDTRSFKREVRFAVVIYGGVSLAVYINGVVQEMLHMVRSTQMDGKDLKGVEKVYRKLACLVGEPAQAESAGEREKRPGGENEAGRRTKRPSRADLTTASLDKEGTLLKALWEEEGPQSNEQKWDKPQTKFVVDILSGTSAGGINAIFLAKALATGASLDSLANLWITQADMTQLLNDKKVTPSAIRQNPPPSLLNSQWMYLQLLKALQEMSVKAPKVAPGQSASLVDDLDLYCTTTDLDGLPVLLPLTDKGVYELRYKSEFHFQHRPQNGALEERNDLSEAMDPFLAFAARCTSSFPVAFEPMMLEDILQVVKLKNLDFGKYFSRNLGDQLKKGIFGAATQVGTLSGAAGFEKVCPIYAGFDAGKQVAFNKRAFADGGYLHNKPFSYAIETLKKRSATLPVDRKLVYLEPEPEEDSALGATPRDAANEVIRQNAIQNGLDALTVLPRYQTIREDILSVVEWNSNIARLQRVIEDMQEGVKKEAASLAETVKYTEWQSRLGYAGYLRLRLSSAVDQLAERLAAAMNVEPGSVEGTALRIVVGAWRDREFGGHNVLHPESGDRALQREFLLRFDFEFLRRALRYLRTRLLEEDGLKEASEGGELASLLERLSKRYEGLTNLDAGLDLGQSTANPELKPLVYAAWRACLRFITDPTAASWLLEPSQASRLGESLSASNEGCAQRVQWLFENPHSPAGFVLDQGLAAKVVQLGGLEPDKLDLWQSQGAGSAARLHWAQDQLKKPGSPFPDLFKVLAFQAMKDYVAKALEAKFGVTSEDGITPLQQLLEDGPESMQGAYRKFDDLLGQSKGTTWREFELQDSLVFPVIFGTDLGEFETVDVFRISPRDAGEIPNVHAPEKSGKAPLKGSSLDAFGGFLDRSWRLNDMLRGRLDGADRLITAILPDADPTTVKIREFLIRRAQEAIAEEWVEFQQSLPPEPERNKKTPAKSKATVPAGLQEGR